MARRPPPRRRPPRGSFASRTFAIVKRNPIKSITAALVLVGSIPAAMGGITYLDARAEPLYLAMHWWVRDIVGSVEKKIDTSDLKTTAILRDLQIDTADGKRASTINDIKKWQLELTKAPDQASVDNITQQIETLQDTKSKLDGQINTLRAIKGSAR